MDGEPDWESRRQLGWDESTSPKVRDQLLRDPDMRVRAAATQHASPEQLRMLATDPRAEVRSAVGANAQTPPDVLLALTEDRSVNVRWWVVAGAQTQKNKEVLRRLGDDKDRNVAATARTALDGMRLYRRILDLPGNAMASLFYLGLERRRQD